MRQLISHFFLWVALAQSAVGLRQTRMLMVLARSGSHHNFQFSSSDLISSLLSNGGSLIAHNLGLTLRRQWKDFISPHYNFNENLVYSLSTRRSRVAAEAIMVGLYPLTTFKKMKIELEKAKMKPYWVPGLARQDAVRLFETEWTIPINSVYPRDDHMLAPLDTRLCPAFDPFVVRPNDPLFQELNLEIGFFLKSLDQQKLDPKGLIFDFNLPNNKHLARVAEYFLLEKQNLAKTLGPEDLDTLERLQTAQYWIQHFRDEKRLNFYLTHWARKMVSLLEEAELAILAHQSHPKIVIFASTGKMLMAYLLKTGFFRVKCLASQGGKMEECDPYPPFGSEITWELFEEDGRLFIEANYNGRLLQTCGAGIKCPLSTFITILRGFQLPGSIDQLRQEFCTPSSESPNHALRVAVLFNLAVMTVLLGVLITLKKRLK